MDLQSHSASTGGWTYSCRSSDTPGVLPNEAALRFDASYYLYLHHPFQFIQYIRW